MLRKNIYHFFVTSRRIGLSINYYIHLGEEPASISDYNILIGKDWFDGSINLIGKEQ